MDDYCDTYTQQKKTWAAYLFVNILVAEISLQYDKLDLNSIQRSVLIFY